MRKLSVVLFFAVVAIATLGFVRSKMLAEERRLNAAAVQYSALRKIYARLANLP